MARTEAEQGAVRPPAASEPTIVKTKLARPPARVEHVARRGLLNLLDRGATRKLRRGDTRIVRPQDNCQ